MAPRLDYQQASPGALKAMFALEKHVHQSELEESLIELVKMRVSQINGCAHCLDMHSKDARAAGESEQRLYVLPAWRETTFYTPRERAALAWAEAVTLLADHEISDELYDEVQREFGETGTVDLTIAVIAINGWNRLAVPFRAEVGSYQPGAYAN